MKWLCLILAIAMNVAAHAEEFRDRYGNRRYTIENGVIRDNSGSRIGEIDGNRVRDKNGQTTGYIQRGLLDDTQLRDRAGSLKYRIEPDGTVRDKYGTRMGTLR